MVNVLFWKDGIACWEDQKYEAARNLDIGNGLTLQLSDFKYGYQCRRGDIIDSQGRRFKLFPTEYDEYRMKDLSSARFYAFRPNQDAVTLPTTAMDAVMNDVLGKTDKKIYGVSPDLDIAGNRKLINVYRDYIEKHPEISDKSLVVKILHQPSLSSDDFCEIKVMSIEEENGKIFANGEELQEDNDYQKELERQQKALNWQKCTDKYLYFFASEETEKLISSTDEADYKKLQNSFKEAVEGVDNEIVIASLGMYEFPPVNPARYNYNEKMKLLQLIDDSKIFENISWRDVEASDEYLQSHSDLVRNLSKIKTFSDCKGMIECALKKPAKDKYGVIRGGIVSVDDFDFMKMVVSRGDVCNNINIKDEDGNTLMHRFVQRVIEKNGLHSSEITDFKQIFQQAEEAGFDFTQKNNQGQRLVDVLKKVNIRYPDQCQQQELQDFEQWKVLMVSRTNLKGKMRHKGNDLGGKSDANEAVKAVTQRVTSTGRE